MATHQIGEKVGMLLHAHETGRQSMQGMEQHPNLFADLVCCRCCVSGICILEESSSVPEYFGTKIVIVGGIQPEISIKM